MKKLIIALSAAGFLVPSAAFAGGFETGISTDAYYESGTSASLTHVTVDSDLHKYNKINVYGEEHGINVSVSAENLKLGVGGFGFDDSNDTNQDSLAAAAAADDVDVDVDTEVDVSAADFSGILNEELDVVVDVDTEITADGEADAVVARNDTNGNDSSTAGGWGIIADGSGSATGTMFNNGYNGKVKEWGSVHTDVNSFVAEADAWDGYNASASSFKEWN